MVTWAGKDIVRSLAWNFKLDILRVAIWSNFLQCNSPVMLHLMILWILHTAGFLLVSFIQFKQKLCRNYQVKCYALCYGAVILNDHIVPFRHYKSMNLRNSWLKGNCGAATAFLSGESCLGHVLGRETVLCWGDEQRWELTFGFFTVTGIANTCSLQKYIFSCRS